MRPVVAVVPFLVAVLAMTGCGGQQNELSPLEESALLRQVEDARAAAGEGDPERADEAMRALVRDLRRLREDGRLSDQAAERLLTAARRGLARVEKDVEPAPPPIEQVQQPPEPPPPPEADDDDDDDDRDRGRGRGGGGPPGQGRPSDDD